MIGILIFMACNVLSSIDCAIEIKVENCVVEFSGHPGFRYNVRLGTNKLLFLS